MRGSGGGGGGIGGRVALGGGGLGVVGLIIYFVISQLGGISPGAVNLGSGGGLGSVGSGQQVDNSQLASTCKTGADANKNHDCAIVAIVNSVQDYWAQQFARSGSTYRKAPTNFFNGGVRTGCGSATSDTGPFYCPADSKVYIDLSFFNELKTRFGAQGGQFTEAYVLAHEYGHHVQNLLGTSKKGTGTGPTSGSVRLELQADCYMRRLGQPRDDDADRHRQAADPRHHAGRHRVGAGHGVPDRRRLHPDQARRRPGGQLAVHPRHVRAAQEVVHHRLPDR